jgi:hypothetical protein
VGFADDVIQEDSPKILARSFVVASLAEDST